MKKRETAPEGPKRQTTSEIQEQALAMYRTVLALETTERGIAARVTQLIRTADFNQRVRAEISAAAEKWCEENLPGPVLLTDEEQATVRAAYRKAVVDYAVKHAMFIAEQHAQDLANLVIPPLPDA